MGFSNGDTAGPSDISREEGETNVYIPCPFYGTPYNPIWKINDSFYEASSLPDGFVAAASGLEIIEVTASINLTTFQCFNSTTLECSNEGLLTVTVTPVRTTQGNLVIILQLVFCFGPFTASFVIVLIINC